MASEIIPLPIWTEPSNLEDAKLRILDLGKNLHEHAYLSGLDLQWVQNHLPWNVSFESWVTENIWYGIRTALRFIAHAKVCKDADFLVSYHPTKSVPNRVIVTVKGTYQTVIIDPPWPISKIERYERPLQTQETTMDEYKTMTIKAIKESSFPFGNHCHVFLWTTQKFLPDAFDCFKVWKVRYLCTLIWHKQGGFQPVGLPQYNCEFILYGRKGSPKFVDTKDFFCCFTGQRREHSRKPVEFDETVRRVTAGSRIEIFTREEKEGFESFGDEVNKFGV